MNDGSGPGEPVPYNPVTDAYFKLDIFRTLLQYDNNVEAAIANTKLVLRKLIK